MRCVAVRRSVHARASFPTVRLRHRRAQACTVKLCGASTSGSRCRAGCSRRDLRRESAQRLLDDVSHAVARRGPDTCAGTNRQTSGSTHSRQRDTDFACQGARCRKPRHVEGCARGLWLGVAARNFSRAHHLELRTRTGARFSVPHGRPTSTRSPTCSRPLCDGTIFHRVIENFMISVRAAHVVAQGGRRRRADQVEAAREPIELRPSRARIAQGQADFYLPASSATTPAPARPPRHSGVVRAQHGARAGHLAHDQDGRRGRRNDTTARLAAMDMAPVQGGVRPHACEAAAGWCCRAAPALMSSDGDVTGEDGDHGGEACKLHVFRTAAPTPLGSRGHMRRAP